MQHLLLTLTLGPILLFQGRQVRRRMPVLAEPPGERKGIQGKGPGLLLLITGDSAAAGVGASHQDEALLGQLVAVLKSSFRVEWTLQAKTGATTLSTLRDLRQLGEQRFDVVVTSLGVNDVTSGIRRSSWRRQQAQLRTLIQDRFDARLTIVSGLPPMHAFPALPQPLRWYLGRRAMHLDRDLKKDVAEDATTEFSTLRFSDDIRLMSADGFHPGPRGYAEWARRLGESILGSPALRS